MGKIKVARIQPSFGMSDRFDPEILNSAIRNRMIDTIPPINIKSSIVILSLSRTVASVDYFPYIHPIGWKDFPHMTPTQ